MSIHSTARKSPSARRRSGLLATLAATALTPLLAGNVQAQEFASPQGTQRLNADRNAIIALAGLTAAALVLLNNQQNAPVYVLRRAERCGARYEPAYRLIDRPRQGQTYRVPVVMPPPVILY